MDAAVAAIQAAVGMAVPRVEIPVLYTGLLEGTAGAPIGDIVSRSSLAWSPGMANFQFTTPPHRVWAADPHGPPLPASFVPSDAFRREATIRLPAGTIAFPENWTAYHIHMGEVHCGTNVRRQPFQPNWWELLP